MLQVCDVPAGQDGSWAISIVHFCEQMLWPSLSNELVHTPLAHSVDMSLAVVHVAPNGRLVSLPEPLPAASEVVGTVASVLHAASRSASTARVFMMAPY